MGKPLLIIVSLFCCLSGTAVAEDFLTTNETYFKKTTQQSSDLPDTDKCLVLSGTLFSTESKSVDGVHLKVTTQNNLSDCGFTSGYFYEPHLASESHLITVTANSVFKKRPLSSSQLPSDEKCDIFPGVYAAQNEVPSANDGHYFVNLRNLLSGCHFSEGYLWEGHTQTGSLAVQITFETKLKKSPVDSSQLPSSDFCEMPVGLYALGAGASSSGETHYQITLAKNLEGCDFNSGYVYYDHTNWEKPYVAPPEPTFTFPLPNGYYTSGWCVCRNIGTSPHIGQDISKVGTKTAVAVQEGVLDSTTYSSTCGYISYLEDDFGTLWRYVHLNNPSVAAGKRVNKGQHLAYISQYPKSGCGSGAHLHFERRSAGYFNDSSTGKSCQNGYRSCYYDPIKPWRSAFSSKQVNKQTLSANTNWSTLAKPKNNACKVPFDSMPSLSASRLEDYPIDREESLTVKFDKAAGEAGYEYFDARIFLKGNQKNSCKGKRCIIQWQLVSQNSESDLKSVFFHNRVRNIPLVREAKEKHCLSVNAKTHWLLVKDNEGKRWRIKI